MASSRNLVTCHFRPRTIHGTAQAKLLTCNEVPVQIQIPMSVAVSGPSSAVEGISTTAVVPTVIKKGRPARKQVESGAVVKKEQAQTGRSSFVFGTEKLTDDAGSVYNIWYNKWAGGDREDGYSKYVQVHFLSVICLVANPSAFSKEHAQTRVNVKRDSGYTQADKLGKPYICLFFARGCCPYASVINRSVHSDFGAQQYQCRLPMASSVAESCGL